MLEKVKYLPYLNRNGLWKANALLYAFKRIDSVSEEMLHKTNVRMKRVLY